MIDFKTARDYYYNREQQRHAQREAERQEWRQRLREIIKKPFHSKQYTVLS